VLAKILYVLVVNNNNISGISHMTFLITVRHLDADCGINKKEDVREKKIKKEKKSKGKERKNREESNKEIGE
jgi:hypothetical protein